MSTTKALKPPNPPLPESLVKVWQIPSSSTSLNTFLGGGFLRGIAYTWYGKHDRGKSNALLDMAFNAGELGFYVAYIDGDNHGITVHRLYTIIKARYPNDKVLEPTKVDPNTVYNYYQKLLEKYKIDIFWETNLAEVKQRCKEIADSRKYTVIIVDSVSLFYAEYVSASNNPNATKEGTADITSIYSSLRDSAILQEHLKVLVFTTQRTSDVKEAMRINVLEKKEKYNIQVNTSDKEEIDLYMGGKSPGYFSDVIIQLTKFKDTRKTEYVKNRLSKSDKVGEFIITDAGIQDIGPSKK